MAEGRRYVGPNWSSLDYGCGRVSDAGRGPETRPVRRSLCRRIRPHIEEHGPRQAMPTRTHTRDPDDHKQYRPILAQGPLDRNREPARTRSIAQQTLDARRRANRPARHHHRAVSRSRLHGRLCLAKAATVTRRGFSEVGPDQRVPITLTSDLASSAMSRDD